FDDDPLNARSEPSPPRSLRRWRRRRSVLGRGALGTTRARTRATPLVRPNSPTRGSSTTSNSASLLSTPSWSSASSLASSTDLPVVSTHSNYASLLGVVGAAPRFPRPPRPGLRAGRLGGAASAAPALAGPLLVRHLALHAPTRAPCGLGRGLAALPAPGALPGRALGGGALARGAGHLLGLRAGGALRATGRLDHAPGLLLLLPVDVVRDVGVRADPAEVLGRPVEGQAGGEAEREDRQEERHEAHQHLLLRVRV